jgi:flagella basal body P-ring formation protein FlgA
MTPLAALAVAGCLAVGSGADQLVLRDLAAAFENTAELPLDTVVALAPAPGVQRRFELAELRRLAVRLHLPEPRREICVERSVAPLDPSRLIAAMQAQLPGARIELLDYSRQPAPEGVLEFAPAGLRPAPGGASWIGSIQYGGRHRMAVWARVNVSVTAPRVIAVDNLPTGRPLEAALLRIETTEEFPSAGASPSTIEEVAGKVLRRPVRAGMAIRSSWLEEPKAVARGETVQVEVREGGALLQLPGVAQGAGAIGETILVLNPTSNKRFRARVEARGKVGVGKETF